MIGPISLLIIQSDSFNSLLTPGILTCKFCPVNTESEDSIQCYNILKAANATLKK